VVAIVSSGYAGPIFDPDWAAQANDLLGNGSRIVSGFRGTPVAAGTRQTSVSAGVAYGCGVRDVMPGATVVQHPTVTSGSRWDAVALRRDWGTRTTALAVVPGGPSEVLPGSLRNEPGVLHDEPILLVQVTAGQTVPTAVRNLTTPPRHESHVFAYALSGDTVDAANVLAPSGEEWPQEAAVALFIPRWANRIAVATTWGGVQIPPTPAITSTVYGAAWTRLETFDLQPSRYWLKPGDQGSTKTLHAAAEIVIPAVLKGRVARLCPRAHGPTSGPQAVLDNVSSVSMLVDLKE